MVVIPTKEVADKEVVIESEPELDISGLEKEAFITSSEEKQPDGGSYRPSGTTETAG